MLWDDYQAIGSTLSTVLEAGYASGDTNAFDRTQNTFRFDSNHRVGTILYPHLLRTLTAVSAHNIDDPNFRADPPRGFEKLPTQGAVENSVYFTPRLMWAIHPSLSVNIGWLWARSATPWSDAYRTGLNGGTATGPYGRTGSTDLGQEWHVGADYTVSFSQVQLVSRGWFTRCEPGEIFKTASGSSLEPLYGGGLMMGVLW